MKKARTIVLWLALVALVAVHVAVWATATSVSVQRSVKSGTLLTMSTGAYSLGNSFFNDGKTYLIVQKAATAATSTLTIATGGTVGGYAIDNQSVSLAQSTTNTLYVIGPFSTDVFNDSSNNVTVTYSEGTTGVKVAAVRMPN